MQVQKAKPVRVQTPQARPPAGAARLARTEVVDMPTRGRIEAAISAALERADAGENKVIGAARALAPQSPALRVTLAELAQSLLRQGATNRELYTGSLRAVAEAGDKASTPLLKAALTQEDGGGPAALSAACFSRDEALAPQLTKLAASRQSHLAFGAETARVARAESSGAHLAALAPMIKESHRISLCSELFAPLARHLGGASARGAAPGAAALGPALGVLRSAERHLGRWLVLAEVAARSGDGTPLAEARAKSDVGPTSARAAWTLVAWALADATAKRGDVPPPTVRPTLELVARLSDRPSADRDPTFLFRMARAGAPVARGMLESMLKAPPLADDAAVRAALYLARDHGRKDLLDALADSATAAVVEDVRGLAAAALWDAGDRARARDVADSLVASPIIGNVAWGALIRASAARGGLKGGPADELVTEALYRWIQWGWLE